MKNLTLHITDHSTKKKFELHLSHKQKSEESISIVFGNNSGSLERARLDFFDNSKKVVEPIGYTMITPAAIEKTEVTISKHEPFVYIVQGELLDLGDKVHLKLKSIEYLFIKGEKYSVRYRYAGESTDLLELIFD